jgi:glyoxylase-like metal-dependent hydrolase (beta-lactamase superfamily II)
MRTIIPVMRAARIVRGVYRISLGMVNAFLVDASSGSGGEGLTLVDTGIPGSAGAILEAIASIGKRPADLKAIVVTHLHADHAGSAAALVAATGASLYMHRDDAVDFLRGECMRAVEPAPGSLNRAVVALASRTRRPRIESSPVDAYLEEGMEIPGSGGLVVLHLPGHSAGHCAFLWPGEGGVLFVGDAASAMFGRLGPSFLYEDYALGLASLGRVSRLDFAVACLGHGKPITRDARNSFARIWGGEGGRAVSGG